MVKHSLSHAAVSLTTLVGTQIVADSLARRVPDFYNRIEQLAGWTIEIFDLPMRQGQVELMLVALMMGLLWGITFWHLSAEKVVR